MLMIAQQVASKAARDGLFLTVVSTEALPKVMLLSAFISLLTVGLVTRALVRFTPAVVVPLIFVGNAAFFVAEWALLEERPRLVAWLLYLHLGALGAAVISGFWSVLSERFDPHAAKAIFARIGVAATFGGLVGGVGAERIAAWLGIPSLLAVLAMANFLCAVGALLVGGRQGRRPHVESQVSSGVRALTEIPYLRQLASLVALLAVAGSMVDYGFKAQASLHLEGERLVQFFALFYAGTGALAFVVQSTVARRTLDRIGLGRTVALLPAVMLLTTFLAAAAPRLWSVVLARASETILNNSLFRSGYELLFTPLTAERKRATKTTIDVACARLGDALGSGVVWVVVFAAPQHAVTVVLAIAAAVSLLAYWIAQRLHDGYVAALADSLKRGAVRLIEADVIDRTTRTTLTAASMAMERDQLRARLEEMRQKEERLSAADDLVHSFGSPYASTTRLDSHASTTVPKPRPALAPSVSILEGHDLQAIRSVLGKRPFDVRLVGTVIPLIATEELRADVAEALRSVAPRVSGQLFDRLLDENEDVVVRRRLPRVVSACSPSVAVRGLLNGLTDPLFEVRYRCGQALLEITRTARHVPIASPVVLSAVRRELETSQEVWRDATRGTDSDGDDDDTNWVDEVTHRRIHRRLGHIFTVLGLILDRETLELSLKALFSGDRTLRGTALEYLESVLPEDIQSRLSPLFDAGGARRPPRSQPRPKEAIVQDLVSSLAGVSIDRGALKK